MTVSQATDFTRNFKKGKIIASAFAWMFLEVNLFSCAGPTDCSELKQKAQLFL